MKTAQYIMTSQIGPIYLSASEKGLKNLYWRKVPGPFLENLKGKSKEETILAKTVRQLEQYFAGQRVEFDLPLDLEGTEFQTLVWSQLRKIPFGKTSSYGELARRLGKEKAFRAVGTANGKNPISIIVPCHRVIAADGSLGGYSGGLDVKVKLLELEQSWPTQLIL